MGEGSWERIRGEIPLNEERVAAYRRLIEAQQQIGESLIARGDPAADRLELAAEAADELATETDLYLESLARFVAELGGRLEVRAVFGEQAIVVRREPPG